VPHFEKMLYDNALLAHAYLEAVRATGSDRYARVARATLDFMLGELRTDDGGLASALDADSEGVEGRFYVWAYDEFMAVLADAGLDDPQRRLLADYWGLTEAGNWEGTNVLHRAGSEADPDLVERGRTALLAARASRTRPARDEKQIASWNGLALRAMAHGALVLRDDAYLEATRSLVEFVERRLLREEDRLWRTVRDGRGGTPGFAEDYLGVADGLLMAHAALGDGDPLDLAQRLVATAVRDFWDTEAGTFVDTSHEHDVTMVRPRALVDNAIPSANAVGADVLQRLALLTGDEDLARRVRSVVRAVAPALEHQPSAFGRMLSAADRLLGSPIDVVVAEASPGDGRALRETACAPYVPDLVLATVATGDAHQAWPLFTGKVARDGRPTAYACRGYACDEPTRDPARLTEQVMSLGAQGARA
jgi:uncharacterized protein